MLELKTNDRFAGCRILAICGQGGYGTVYLAEDALGATVAIKLVNTPDRERELAGLRAYVEVAKASPQLLAIRYAGIEQNELFYIMDAADSLPDSPVYVADTLGNRIRRYGRCSPDDALQMVRKLASGVQVLHQAGLIHRDIKPDNVIFVHGEPRLSDPGMVCSMERTITLAGTLGYLPPECFAGTESNSPASDVYALGKLFYCAVTGCGPGDYPHLPHDMSGALCRKIYPILLKACNKNRRKRCCEIGEFIRLLPESLPGPTVWDRRREAFRTWRLIYPWRWRMVCVSVLVLVLLAVGGTEWCRKTAARQAAERQQCLIYVRKCAAKLRSGREGLQLQLPRLIGQTRTAELLALPDQLPPDPVRAAALCRKTGEELHQAAGRALEEAFRMPDVMQASGNVRGLLDSPLAAYLSEAERKQYMEQVQKLEKERLRLGADMPKPGKSWYMDSSRAFDFVYVPAGEFVSPTTGKTVRIPDPFWVQRTETSVKHFSKIMQFIPDPNGEPGRPVVGLLWNDFLYFCRILTNGFANWKNLPPGYIVRPLTEDEWEWCALGGWKGNAGTTVWSRENSGGRLHVAGGSTPNALGLQDMFGNAWEMTFARAPRRPDAVMTRGGAYNTARKDALTRRRDIAFYQSFLPDTACRLAIAKGDIRQLDQAFQTGEPVHFEYHGRQFELFGHLIRSWRKDSMENLCRLLGGRPGSLDSPELVQAIRPHFSPVDAYNIGIVAECRGGRWYWPSGKPVPETPSGNGQFPAWKNGHWVMMPEEGCSSCLCEWSPEEWRQVKNFRDRLGLHPGEVRLKRPHPRDRIVKECVPYCFRLGKYEYYLVKLRCYPHVMRRIAALLGGRLARPRDAEQLRLLAAQLKDFSRNPVLLDGFWKFGSYRWSDGTPAAETLPMGGVWFDTSPSLSAPALLNGKFVAIQLTDYSLLEFPISFSN